MFEHCWEITLRGSMLKRLPLRLPGRGRLAPASFATASGVLHLVLLATSLALVGEGLVYQVVLGAQLGADRRPRWSASGSRATTSSSPGRPSSRSGTTSAAACPRRGRRRRAPAEPGARRCDRRHRARAREPRARARRARGQARRRRAGALPADARRQGRRGLRAAEAADDGRRRRDDRGRATRSTAATAGSRASGASSAGTSIDELPQLWNVVRGEMSVIGPRPTLRYQVEQYYERQRQRLDVLPGITGWAQIHGRASLLVGRADRAGRLVRRAPLAAHRPADPRCARRSRSSAARTRARPAAGRANLGR